MCKESLWFSKCSFLLGSAIQFPSLQACSIKILYSLLEHHSKDVLPFLFTHALPYLISWLYLKLCSNRILGDSLFLQNISYHSCIQYYTNNFWSYLSHMIVHFCENDVLSRFAIKNYQMFDIGMNIPLILVGIFHVCPFQIIIK